MGTAGGAELVVVIVGGRAMAVAVVGGSPDVAVVVGEGAELAVDMLGDPNWNPPDDSAPNINGLC